MWSATREAALTDDLVQARRDLQSEPLSPSRLQAVALAAAALRDYHATAVAAVQAMMKEQEDPFMARFAVAAVVDSSSAGADRRTVVCACCYSVAFSFCLLLRQTRVSFAPLPTKPTLRWPLSARP